MTKVIPFSTRFQKTHVRSGEPTYFVEQILNSIYIDYRSKEYLQDLCLWNEEKLADGRLSMKDLQDFKNNLNPKEYREKIHTIRGGERFKEGEIFQPVVWSKSAYTSPQILFAPELEIKQTFSFDFDGTWFLFNGQIMKLDFENELAKNDGLSVEDFKKWFKGEFKGQGIAWEELTYNELKNTF